MLLEPTPSDASYRSLTTEQSGWCVRSDATTVSLTDGQCPHSYQIPYGRILRPQQMLCVTPLFTTYHLDYANPWHIELSVLPEDLFQFSMHCLATVSSFFRFGEIVLRDNFRT